MGSPLDFVSSEGFRKSLIIKNLAPYAKSPNRQSPPINYEYIQSNLSVIDSPDALIDEPTFANKLYPLNEWGAEGGYKDVSGVGDILPRKSNQGEYGPGQQDAKILEQALPESKNWKKINPYSNGSQSVIDSAEFFSTLEYPEFGTGLFNNQPYFTFVPSSYSPLSILLNPDPQGDNGLLSQDSYIVKLGAQTLKREFQERIAAQIRQDTIGRANLFSVDGASDILNIINGRVPLIEPNWTITIPENPVLAATNFILRLGGSILPVSTIPGSYFDENATLRQPTTIQQATNAFRQSAVGNFFRTLLGTNLSGSEIFYNNTGQGQKSVLFKNINYNKYKPSFDRTLFNRVGGAVVGSTTDNSNFYIGSNTSDPSLIFSPPGELPVNEYGQEQQSPVYGPSEMAQLYEGPSKEIRLAANGPTYSSGGGIEGGLTWVSPKYKGNAGKKVGIGGEVTNQDEDFKPSSFNSTESTNIQFRQGSILDDTQRLVDSQPQGGRRLQHVGNAIDQVSKVFNDGYKELTKGSRVLSYVGAIGQEVGTEYCRVFGKDIPYLQYNDLQKTDGITTEGRRFSWSVLDKTYNLNIAPNKQEGGQSSTNLINAPGGLSTNVGYAKKYMFSLENLAWRTSSTPGYTVGDLPICERGPNGGRVMWFPPYGLTFTENTNASWKANDFLGRPEPIYTYQNTSRSGTLNWKIVVDHPSALNVIVNKVLNNETNKTRIDSILDSFFAGCRKYDLYELAKKYNTIPPNDLYQIQQAITSKEVTRKQLEFIKDTLPTGLDSTGQQSQDTASNPEKDLFKNYVNNLSFYFGNGYPYQDNQNYQDEYDRYTSPTNKEVYKKRSPSTAEQTSSFFEFAVQPNFEKSKEFIKNILQNLKEYPNGSVTIVIGSSCSAPASKSYNLELSKRRINSVITYLKKSELSEFIDKRVFLKSGKVGGETASVKKFDPKTKSFVDTSTVNCTDNDKGAKGGDTTVGADEIFTVNAMACRRAYIEQVEQTLTKPVPTPQTPTAQPQEVLVGNVVEKTVSVPVIEEKLVAKDNITKRVLRHLLSECDYFETIKEETPMVYDNLKDKLKFFQPAFHSTTPEGLNSRLTFLQQCMRPGDTIPTIKQVDGNAPILEYNDAYNTAFGTPPVLVLRVGDFYNTKIIPDSLAITYENLDFNPEGIGVQPMIANITLGFKFVGGSGLKNSIDKLQNALTFNYYANTEIYDERADVTDESYQVIDKEFLDSISQPPPTLNQSQPNNGKSNQNTIGVIKTKEIGDFETGTITYSDVMETLKTETQNYFTTLVNKNKEITSQYNNAVRQQWMLNRNYTQGRFSLNSNLIIELFGKPSQFQKNIDKVFTKYLEEIKNGNDPYLQFISNKNFSDKLTRQAKENYINLVKDKKNTFLNGVTTITQEIVNMEQNYINLLGKINTITYIPSPGTQGTDGFQESNGMSVIYCISGTPDVNMSSSGATNTLQELENDVKKVRTSLLDFNLVTRQTQPFTFKSNQYSGVLISEVNANGDPVGSMVLDENKVFNQFSKNTQFDNQNFKRMYMILSDVVLDDKKYETFKNSMIGNIISNPDLIGNGRTNLEEVFDKYWLNTAKPAFLDENEITLGFVDDMEKTKLKDYLNYTPYEKKDRVFTFTSENTFSVTVQDFQKRLIIGLGSNLNINSDTNTWNDKPDISTTEDVRISKAKLN